MEQFDEIELNEVLVLVQDQINLLRAWVAQEKISDTSTLETLLGVETKILKMLDE
jgi:hypothetical protein